MNCSPLSVQFSYVARYAPFKMSLWAVLRSRLKWPVSTKYTVRPSHLLYGTHLPFVVNIPLSDRRRHKTPLFYATVGHTTYLAVATDCFIDTCVAPRLELWVTVSVKCWHIHQQTAVKRWRQGASSTKHLHSVRPFQYTPTLLSNDDTYPLILIARTGHANLIAYWRRLHALYFHLERLFYATITQHKHE